MTFHALLVLKGNMHNSTDKEGHVRKQPLQLIQICSYLWTDGNCVLRIKIFCDIDDHTEKDKYTFPEA